MTTDSAVEHRRGNSIIRANAPPVIMNGGSIVDAFDGEFISNDVYDVVITGATTAGDPVNGTGYVIQDQTAAHFEFGLFQSGKNANPYNNADRTGWFMDRRRLSHAGNGDGWHAAWNVTVLNQDETIVGIQGVPAGGQLGGDTFAAVDDVILQNMEFNINDNGFDVVGKGITLNFHRENDTAAKGQHWFGVRLQSLGTKNVDAAFQGVGAWRNGVDLAQGDFDRAIALKDGQFISYDGDPDFIPAAPQWLTAQAATTGDYIYNGQRVYIAATTGTTGATPPTHSSGTVSDGGVDWTFVVNNSFNGFTRTDGGTYTGKIGGLLVTFVNGVEAESISDSAHILSGRKTIVESLATGVRSESMSTALDATDSVVLIDATATNPTFTLPLSAAYLTGNAGRMTLKRTGAGGTVTIQRASADNIIDKTGATVTSFTLAANQAVELVGDGVSTWHILYIL